MPRPSFCLFNVSDSLIEYQHQFSWMCLDRDRFVGLGGTSPFEGCPQVKKASGKLEQYKWSVFLAVCKALAYSGTPANRATVVEVAMLEYEQFGAADSVLDLLRRDNRVRAHRISRLPSDFKVRCSGLLLAWSRSRMGLRFHIHSFAGLCGAESTRPKPACTPTLLTRCWSL